MRMIITSPFQLTDIIDSLRSFYQTNLCAEIKPACVLILMSDVSFGIEKSRDAPSVKGACVDTEHCSQHKYIN